MKWIKKESKTIWWIPVIFISLYVIGFVGSESILSFYIISLVIFLGAGIFCSVVHLLLLPKHRIIHLFLMISCVPLSVFWINLKNTDYSCYFIDLYSLLGMLFVSFLFLFAWNNYRKEDVNLMKKSIAPDWIIKLTVQNIIKNEVKNRFKGKVSYPVASRMATGVLAETLSSGRSDLFSDNLISTAMSIAEHHITSFETGGHSVPTSHSNEFNPATGLAMTSDYFDAGGDVYGSSLNHDSHFSNDTSISSSLDSNSIDHGSSFNNGFDDNRF